MLGLLDFRDLPSAAKKIINTHIDIGSGRDLRISCFTMLIISLVGFIVQIKLEASKPDGTFRKLLDLSKINRLGWKEKVSLEEGIKII